MGSGNWYLLPVNPEAVFKAYDIRGRTDTGELDESLYEAVGHAVAAVLAPAAVAIGRDCRATSAPFFRALARGLTGSGVDVIDLGEVPTDAVYFYSGANEVAGAVITASHNPPEYNGLKLCRAGASPVGADTGLREIKERVMAGTLGASDAEGTLTSADIIDDYVDHLLSIVPPASVSALSVAVDGGNGMAGVAVEKVFDRLDASLVGLYLDPDGSFPNHPADPMVPENLDDLKSRMAAGRFDLGVAFDGDADRAFFLDDKAEPLSGSTVTSLIARSLLAYSPGAPVVHNLITSKAVPEVILESGGRPIRTKVGHSFIKQVMAESGAVFGGEHSGHYYFKDNFRADSGMLAALFLMRIMSEDGRALSVMRADVERYEASGEINFAVRDVDSALRHIASSMADESVDRLDGLTIDFGDEWFNLRPSNTEPLLRLNVEAQSAERVDEIVEKVTKLLEEVG